MDDITNQELHDTENPKVAHERNDVNVLAISKFGIGLAIGTIAVIFLMLFMFHWLYKYESAKNPVVPDMISKERQTEPPAPRLQAQPRVELKELRDGEAKVLSSYGWIDPDKGIARIPIDVAVDQVLKKGFPVKASAGPGFDAQGNRELPTSSSSGRSVERISQ